MTSRKTLLTVAAGAAILAGCAAGPYYDDSYYGGRYRTYSDYPAYSYYNTPDYYVAPPVVSFGLAYNDRHYWDGRRWHHWHG